MYMSRAFERYGISGTVAGTFNCMASLGVVLSNYVFARIAEVASWQVTVLCYLGIAALALILSVITVPIWQKFAKNANT